jgi:hypothetical protein
MYKEDVITAEECMNYLPLKITIFIRIISFNDMDEFQKFKFIFTE